MAIIAFKDTFKGKETKIYAGRINEYDDERHFLEECWNKFGLGSMFKKPNPYTSIDTYFIKASFGSWQFCDANDKERLMVYILNEKVLERQRT